MASITRRNFLQSAGRAAAGATSLSLVSSGVFGAANSMYLALNDVLVGGRVKWPDFARLAASVGFPGVDVKVDAAMKDGVEATKKLLSELKVKPAVINFPAEFRKDDATFRAGLPNLEATARFAQAIGCPRMITWIMSSSNTPKEELRRIYKDRFS